MPRARRAALWTASFAIAIAVWWPSVHWLVRPADRDLFANQDIPPLARRVAARHLQLWTDPTLRQQELAKMRSANAEWDFMGRSYLAWSLANMALRDPSMQEQALTTIDHILDETLRLENERGMFFFLMDYGRERPFIQQPARSQFIDGEIALMLGLRCLVQDNPAWRAALAERVQIMIDRMEHNATLSAESYPDECWTFCNAIALAAIRVHDSLAGQDHTDLFRRWIEMAKAQLIDPQTGMLIAAYTPYGARLYGPEGSSIWMVCHCLALIDEPFARQQYALATQYLARRGLGFGFSREWPNYDHPDVDSGLVLPGLGLSVGATGLAFVGAGQFDDRPFMRSLAATLYLAAFPVEDSHQLRFAASNQVGDAVLLYGLTLGPAWQKLKEARP